MICVGFYGLLAFEGDTDCSAGLGVLAAVLGGELVSKSLDLLEVAATISK